MSSWSTIVSKNSSKKAVKKVEKPIIENKPEEKEIPYLEIFNDNLGDIMLNDVYKNIYTSRQNSLLNRIDGSEIYNFFMNYVDIEDEVDYMLFNENTESSEELTDSEFY